MTIQSMKVTDPRNATAKTCCQSPFKHRLHKTTIVVLIAVSLIILAWICGYLIGVTDFRSTSGKPSEPPDPEVPLPPSPSWLHVFQKAAVCTDAPHCSQIGRDIIYKNGSAVDAAIAAMFCNGVFNMQSMGLGGGFFMTVYIKEEKKAYSVNSREKAPGAATENMFEGNSVKSSKGPLAVGVPGELRGMWAAYKRWGRLPWKSLITPTLEFCKYGFTVSQALHDGMLIAPFIKNDLHLMKMYYNTEKGDFHKVGTVVKLSEEYCSTLARIAESGGDDLYNGSLANDFLDDLNRAGTIITAEDLKNYQPKISDPIAVSLGNGDIIYTAPPPSSGVILLSILNILSGYKFNATSINGTEAQVLTYHRILEAFKYAYAARTKFGDVDYLDLKELMYNITTPEFGSEIRARINDSSTSNSSAAYGAQEYVKDDSGTAHISIIADNGDAVAVTSSINFYFGAGFTTFKTGIVMNNVMDDFSSPGITNYFGVKPSPANYIVAGKRPLSSMSPSIIVDRNGNAKLVIGASGGTKITTAIALTTIRKLWFGQSIKEAVDAPRIHHQLYPMHVEYEYGVTQDVLKGLRAKGHGTVRYRGRGSIVCALYRNKTAIYGNADFRKGGVVVGMD